MINNIDVKNIIAKRVAKEIKNNDIVNLGIGLPTLVSNYIDHSLNVYIHSENGIMNMGMAPSMSEWDRDIVNASGMPASINEGGAFFDSSVAFGIIRGGHIDKSILGAFEVDETGSIANWLIPNEKICGMGGAMDLIVGAKKVIVATIHTQNGKSKILKKCTLPITAMNKVDMIITDMATMIVTKEGLLLTEYAKGYSVRDVLENTEAKLIIDNPIERED